MVRCSGRGPVQNGSPRLERISPEQRQMEGFNVLIVNFSDPFFIFAFFIMAHP